MEAIKAFNHKGGELTCGALNTQKKLRDNLLAKRAKYCMALMDNYAYLHDEVTAWFKWTRVLAWSKLQRLLTKEAAVLRSVWSLYCLLHC